MLEYKSTLASAQPFTEALRASAQRDLSGASPYKAYRGNAADAFRSAAAGALASVDAAGTGSNRDYDNRYNAAQRQLALSGLQFMSDGQRGAQDVANARLSGINGLLSGLFS